MNTHEKTADARAAIAQGHRVSLAGGFGVKLCGPRPCRSPRSNRCLPIIRTRKSSPKSAPVAIVPQIPVIPQSAPDPAMQVAFLRRLLEPHIGKAMSCELAAINGVAEPRDEASKGNRTRTMRIPLSTIAPCSSPI